MLSERAFDELIECTHDEHADAMKSAKASLDDMVEAGQERRGDGGFDPADNLQAAEGHQAALRRALTNSSALTGGGMVAATAVGATLLAMTASPAFADTPTDIQMLQTSASIENLAISTYKTALSLPYVGGPSANGVFRSFATTTMAQHGDHAAAFNSAATTLGGKAQTNPDPKYVQTVAASLSAITAASPSDGVAMMLALAVTLENVAAETYVSFCAMYGDITSKTVTASIMGVEAQHVATLAAMQALLKADDASLLTLSSAVVSKLPAAMGSLGFPHSFYPLDTARPASEGALG